VVEKQTIKEIGTNMKRWKKNIDAPCTQTRSVYKFITWE
jgi:hypothetical protein